MIHRLPSAWYQLQSAPGSLVAQPNPFEFSMDPEARVTGTFIHRLLEQLHDVPPEEWSLDQLHPELWGQRLLQLGLPRDKLHTTIAYALSLIEKMMQDEKAHWIFSPNHHDRACELSLQLFIGNKPSQMILDRTFIDEHQIRWIIDFKTAPMPENEGFLMDEKRQYHKQLHQYAQALEQLGNEKIRCALYYPSFGGWIEWDYEHDRA